MWMTRALMRPAAILLAMAVVALGCAAPSTSPSPHTSARADGSAVGSAVATSPGSTDPGSSVDPGTSPAPNHTPGPGSTDAPGSGGPVPSDGPTPGPGETGVPTPSGSAEPTAAPGGFDPGRVQLALEPFASGLAAPVFLTHAGDGSGDVYVVEREGRIRVLDAAGGVRQGAFLDIRDRVDVTNERGLLGLAFHPRYADNGRFFVYYSDRAGRNLVAEFTGGADGADAASERTILRLNPPYDNHQGGMVGFGPDGFLYVGVGDGGGNSPGDPFGNGQKRSTLLAKVLRIDVDGDEPYAIPKDNPFADGGGGEPEIWAVGLRNPWRFSFDREMGHLFIGDVGQDVWEEVNVAPAGGGGMNFGWSVTEGRECHRSGNCELSRFDLPVAVYDHGKGCSITGGYVYRGTLSPALAGGYLFADFCSGTIWGMSADGAETGGEVPFRKLLGTQMNVVSFGEDEAGEVYVVDIAGSISRVTATPK